MGTNTNPPANAVIVKQPNPGDQVGSDQLGLLAELRVISFLLKEGLSIDVDLDQLRQTLTPFTS